ncbi:hypothetical protein ACOMHN_014542 [Nucella lapillus]
MSSLHTHGIPMSVVPPRNSSVSVARFCDWSEQDPDGKESFVSVSRLYRDIANGPPKASSLSRSQSERARGSWPAAGIQWLGPPGSKARVNPGRMFLRDKGVLTKGERDIIEGIYKNRGDLRRDQAGVKSEYIARSHHDAWLVGKHYRASINPSFEPPLRYHAPSEDDPQDTGAPADRHGLEKPDSGPPEEHHSSATCIMCLNEQKQHQQQQQQQQKHQQHYLQKQQQQIKQKQHQQKLQQQQQKLQTLAQKQRRSVTSPRVNGLPYPVMIHVLDPNKGPKEPSAPPSSPEGVSSESFVMPSASPTTKLVNSGGTREKLVTPPLNLPPNSDLPDKYVKTSEKNGTGAHQNGTGTHQNGTGTHQNGTGTHQNGTGTHQEQKEEGDKKTNTQTSQECDDSQCILNHPDACSHSQTSQDSDDSKRRRHVQVYLPKIAPEATEDEFKSSLVQGRPSLAQERPLSYSDFKSKQKNQPRFGQPDKIPSFSSEASENHKERGDERSLQYCSNIRKTLAPKSESCDDDDSGSKSSLTRTNIPALLAQIEEWQLLDE